MYNKKNIYSGILIGGILSVCLNGVTAEAVTINDLVKLSKMSIGYDIEEFDITDYDVNKDGKISISELVEATKKLLDNASQIPITLKKALTGWQIVDGQTCYYNASGELVKGLYSVEDNIYYFDENGYMQKGWNNINGDVYYFGDDGHMYTNIQVIDGSSYQFGESGIFKTGWVTDEKGNRYYNDLYGFAISGMWQIDGYFYLFNDSGVMQYGEQVFNGETYNFGDDGILRTGWYTPNQIDVYYKNEYGFNVKGFYNVDGVTYFFNPETDGLRTTGWIKYENNEYFIYSDYTIAKGWKTLDEKVHYFDEETGYLYKGVRVVDGVQYNFGAYGIFRTGWIDEGRDYTYYKDAYGFNLKGLYTIDGNTYYFVPEMQYGIKEIDGKVYYFDEETGIMQTNCEKGLYYFGADGVGIRQDVRADTINYFAEEILSGLSGSPYSIYQYVTNNMSYTETVTTNEWKQIVADAMRLKNGSSEYFSAYADCLFKNAKYHTRVAYGTLNGKKYVWNQIYYNEVWYNIDIPNDVYLEEDNAINEKGYIVEEYKVYKY